MKVADARVGARVVIGKKAQLEAGIGVRGFVVGAGRFAYGQEPCGPIVLKMPPSSTREPRIVVAVKRDDTGNVSQNLYRTFPPARGDWVAILVEPRKVISEADFRVFEGLRRKRDKLKADHLKVGERLERVVEQAVAKALRDAKVRPTLDASVNTWRARYRSKGDAWTDLVSVEAHVDKASVQRAIKADPAVRKAVDAWYAWKQEPVPGEACTL